MTLKPTFKKITFSIAAGIAVFIIFRLVKDINYCSVISCGLQECKYHSLFNCCTVCIDFWLWTLQRFLVYIMPAIIIYMVISLFGRAPKS